MKSNAKTVGEYLKSLPADRREVISVVRKEILKNLPPGYQEQMQYGMIGYSVPTTLYPAGYLNDKKTPLPYAALASQKNHMAVYLMNIYGYGESSVRKWFEAEYKKTGKKLDVGKSCVRFTKLENLPVKLIGKAIARVSVKDFIAYYEKSRKK